MKFKYQVKAQLIKTMAEEFKNPEEVEVEILERRDVTIYPSLTEEKKIKRVTFVAPGMPPTTIEIPLDEYTPDVEEARIRQAIREYKESKTEVKRIKL